MTIFSFLKKRKGENEAEFFLLLKEKAKEKDELEGEDKEKRGKKQKRRDFGNLSFLHLFRLSYEIFFPLFWDELYLLQTVLRTVSRAGSLCVEDRLAHDAKSAPYPQFCTLLAK